MHALPEPHLSAAYALNWEIRLESLLLAPLLPSPPFPARLDNYVAIFSRSHQARIFSAAK